MGIWNARAYVRRPKRLCTVAGFEKLGRSRIVRALLLVSAFVNIKTLSYKWKIVSISNKGRRRPGNASAYNLVSGGIR